jgi:PAP2 superfamily
MAVTQEELPVLPEDRVHPIMADERSLVMIYARLYVYGKEEEASLSQWLHQSTWLSIVAAYAYATLHYTVTPAVLVMLYRQRRQE